MAALAGFTQFKDGTTGNDFSPVTNKGFEQLFEVENLGLAVDQGHYIDAKDRFQLCLGKQIVQQHVTRLAAFQIDGDAHAVFVGLIAQFRNAFNLLFFDQLGDLFDQPGFVDLIGYFINDDTFAARLLVHHYIGFGPNTDPTATGAVGFDYAQTTINIGTCREIWARYMLHQAIDVDIRIINQGQRTIDDFVEVVRRNIGGHTDGNAG